MFSVTHFRSEFIQQGQAHIIRKVTMTQFMLVIVLTAVGVGLLPGLEPGVALEELFLMRVNRRVRKDATFSLHGQRWEVPTHLRGQIVTVHFDPIGYTRVEVFFGGRGLGPARLCDKQRNAHILARSNEYEDI